MKSFLLPASLLLLASLARAEGPVAPPEGGDPMDEIKKAAAKVTEGMKASEEALTRIAKGEKADPKGVDIELPKDGNPPPAPKSEPGAGGESLEKSAEQGKQVVDGINRIIENAAKMGGKSKGGGGTAGGGSGNEPDDKDGEKQRNGKKEQESKKDPLKDDAPKGDGDKNKDPKDSEQPKGKKPPPESPIEPPGRKDPSGVFFAQLPAKVREAVLAGDFDQVPERYRDLIREWTKKLAEKEKEERLKGEGK